MQKFTTVAALKEAVHKAKAEGKTIGLVPTMGALHEGHLSLIRKAKEQNDIVIVSVFVNPIQFNNKEDLAKYPRTVDADCEKLALVNADYVLVPSVEEMYPEPVKDVYHFGPLEEVMEGPKRPGHFSGVAVVVRRLFDIAEPDRAYFGEKDYQQLAIIRNLIEQIHYNIEIVPCPGAAHIQRGTVVNPEAAVVAEIEFVAGSQMESLVAVHHGVAENDMRLGVVPVGTVKYGERYPVGVYLSPPVYVECVYLMGVCGKMVNSVSTIGDDRQFLLFVVEIDCNVCLYQIR